MRGLTYFILAYVAIGVQSGMAHALAVGSALPNFALLAVIFITLNAPRDVALSGAFFIGLFQDLCTGTPLGLYAFSYGLVAMFVISTQQIVYREHFITHFSVALIGGLIVGLLVLAQSALRDRATVPAMPLFYGAIYTAVLSPLVIGILNRIRRVFQFQPRRSRGGRSGGWNS